MWSVIGNFEVVRTILSVFAIALEKFWKRFKLCYFSSKIKGPFALPFFGSVGSCLELKRNRFETIMRLCEKYKQMTKIWIGTDLYIIPTNPDDVEVLAHACVGKMKFYENLKPLFGDGLLTAPADVWMNNRKIMNPAFSHIDSYIETFEKHSKNLVTDLKNSINVEVNVFEMVYRCMFCILHETFLEYSNFKHFALYFVNLPRLESIPVNQFVNPFYHSDFIWKMTSDYRYMNDFVLQSYSHLRQILSKKGRDKNNSNKNFMNILSKMTEKKIWTNQQAMDEIQTLIVTGTRTPTVGLCFTFLMLALHQEVQEKVYEEIIEIFGQKDTNCTHDDINRMVYCERVIKETLRLFPPSPITLRDVQQEIFLGLQPQAPGFISNIQTFPGEYIIPEGSSLMIPIIYIHRDPTHWPDPLKFDPDRFLPEEVAKRHKYAYLPFSTPPRNCIGYRFAMMSMKVILATVLRHYKVVSSQYKSLDDIKIEVNVSLEAVEGYGLTFEPRN